MILSIGTYVVMEKQGQIYRSILFFGILGFSLQSCALSFNSPVNLASDSNSSGVVSASFTSPSTSGESVGWLKLLSGTCSNDGEDVVITGTGFTTTLSCSSGTFSDHVDVSALSAGSQSLTLTHGDYSTSITINVVSDNCDSSAIRQRNYASGLGGGDGSSATPYVICTTDQLADLSNASVNDFFSLENDIYFNYEDTNGDGTVAVGVTDTDYLTGSGWTPISLTLQGEFNGNSFSINNLTINRPATNNVGLIAAAIERFYFHSTRFIDVSIVGNNNTGAIIGGNNNPSVRIMNVFVSGSVTGASNTGGVTGRLGGLASFATSTASVSGTSYVGGIAGSAINGAAIINSRTYGSGTISGASDVGGIVGFASSLLVGSSTNEKTVIGSGSYHTGGIIGTVNRSAFVANCINHGAVNGTGNAIGGIIGRAGGEGAVIQNVINTGDVTATGGVGAGGVVGANGGSVHIDNAIVTGSVQGVSNGFVGEIIGAGSHTGTNNWFYSGATCDQDTGTAGIQTCTGNLLTGTRASISDFYNVSNEPLASFDRIGSTANGGDDFWEIVSGDWPNHWWENDNTSGSPIFSGAGTQASPYQITSVAEFLAIGSNPRWMDSYFELNTATLDFTAQTYVQIGGEGMTFHGNFNGQGNTLTNITYSDSNAVLVGVFSIISGGDVTNLNITSSSFTGGENVGGLAGAIGASTISNISYQGSVTGTYYVGGIAGAASRLSATGCSANATINASGHYIGGFSGILTASLVYTSSTVGTVNGNEYTGGFVGYGNGGAVTDTYSQSNVTGTDRVGGFVGSGSGFGANESYASGTVTGDDRTGGFVGFDNWFRCTNSFAAGNVVSDTSDTGAFTGINNGSNGTYTNCYYANDATCDSDSATGGLQACNSVVTNNDTQSNLQDSLNAPLSSWDFTTVWRDESGTPDYPSLN